MECEENLKGIEKDVATNSEELKQVEQEIASLEQKLKAVKDEKLRPLSDYKSSVSWVSCDVSVKLSSVSCQSHVSATLFYK